MREHLATDGELIVGRAALREDTPEVLTLEEAATLLRVKDAELSEAVERGDVPGRRIGTQWRFSRAALLAWLAAAEPDAGRPIVTASES